MQEIPILVVLLYQLFKQQIHSHVTEFIPVIMEFINMRPLPEHTQDQSCKKSKYLDFMAAQVKTLSFLAYVIKIYQETIDQHSAALVKGMMNLMITCPPSITNMRKEFFIATRHILSAQEIRPKFLQALDDMMEDNILIGKGYTVRDSLRPLSYSTLADLIHHLRSDLTLTKIARAVDLYGRNMFDDTLPFSIQQMSQRLIFNLAECIRQRMTESTPSDAAKQPMNASSARRVLLQIMSLCVLKCRIVAEHYIPEFEAKCLREDPESSPENKAPTCEGEAENVSASSGGKQDTSLYSETSTQGYLGISDMRSSIKALVSGMRAVITALTQCPHQSGPEDDTYLVGGPQASSSSPSPKQLLPTEVAVLSDYLTYGLRMLDVLRIVSKDGHFYLRGPNSGAKYPEERFLLETLAMTFVPISSSSFREIFSAKIGYVVDWCRKSPLFYAHFAFHLLSQSSQTSNFGRILLSYLVERLEKIGEGTDVSFTYMRLLKFCFNSVNMTGTENEHVMKLHLRRIVQGSMQHCLEAREPIAYLTLLRALFRSIGGGAHDKLYREFFPLLPEMLTTLNRLLRSAHRTHARDLLGELCVIVPVRLSTLLPYLSLLMEPLTYVLNCNTVNQGLRTLELCVDNMQPDFLYQHLYQVRGDMLLGLYTSLHSQSEYVQKMAFKVLGKMGRFNRADISDVQRLNLNVNCGESGPLLRFWLHEFPQYPVDLPIRSLVDFAVETIQEPAVDYLCRLRAWQFLRGVCISSLNVHICSKTPTGYLSYDFVDKPPPYPLKRLRSVIQQLDSSQPFFYNDKPNIYHLVMVRVVGGIFLSASVAPQIPNCGTFLTFLVRHLTLISLLEERNINSPFATSDAALTLDSRVLVEAVCFVMGHEDKELVRSGYVLLDEIINTATTAIEVALADDPLQTSVCDVLARLPLMHYFAKAIKDMLFHPAWFVKSGGCCILLHLRDRLSVNWFREHLVVFLRGLLHCLHDLTNQMGQGALALAQQCSTALVQFVFSHETSSPPAGSTPPLSTTIKAESPVQSREHNKRTMAARRRPVAASKRGGVTKKRSATPRKDADSPVHDLTEDVEMFDATNPMSSLSSEVTSQTPLMNAILHELVQAMLSETKVVRAQVRSLLSNIAECLSIPLGGLLKPHIHLIGCWLPPKNRFHRLSNLPTSTQIAVLEANYFLCRDAPLGAGLLQYCPMNRRCDNRFLVDLRAIMDSPLPASPMSSSYPIGGRTPTSQLPIFSSLQLQMAVDLKVVASQVLSTMHYLESHKSVILAALFKGMCSDCASVYKPVFEYTKDYVKRTTIDTELRHTYVKPILPSLRQTSNIRLATVRQLAYCAELFPSTFSERFCETIQGIQNSLASINNVDTLSKSVELIAALVNLFHLIPLAGEKYVKPLLNLVIQVEQSLNAEQTSSLRLPLLRFLVRFPEETFRQIFNGFSRPHDGHAHRILLHLMTLPESKPLTDYLVANISLLTDLLQPKEKELETMYEHTPLRLPRMDGPLAQASTSYLALRLLHILLKQRPDWLKLTLSSSSIGESLLTSGHSSVTRVLFNLWGSADFKKRHSCLTLVQLQQTQPNVDLDLLLEDPGDGGRKIIAANTPLPSTCSPTERTEAQSLSGVKVAAGLTDFFYSDEPLLLLDFMLAYAEARPSDFDLLFYIVAGMSRHRCVGYNPLPQYIQRLIRDSSVAWSRAICLHFIQLVQKRMEVRIVTTISSSTKAGSKKKQSLTDSLLADSDATMSVEQYLGTPEAQFKLISQLILPCLQQALERNPAELVALGQPPRPNEPNDSDLVHLFVNLLLNDEASKTCTGLRIMYCQIACHFVFYAPEYVQDISTKVQSYRLRAIAGFVWPCVTSNLNVVDLQEKYTGLQVLAYLIARFYPIMGKATPQVFLCLAKGPQTEVKKMVNPSLDLLLPAWVTGPEEQKALAAATKKIMAEDQSTQMSIHLLGLILRHADLYYSVRHALLGSLIVVISRLSAQQIPIDQRRMILDLIEVTVRWDMRCKSERAALEQQNQHLQQQNPNISSPAASASTVAVVNPASPSLPVDKLELMPMEKSHRDQLANLMIRFACQAMEATPNGISSETSARRALSLIEYTMASEVWGGENCDLRLNFIDRFLCLEDPSTCQSGAAQQQSQQQQQNMNSLLSSCIFMTLEVLRVLYNTLESSTLLTNVKHFSKSLISLLSRYPTTYRLMRACATLIKVLLIKFPAESSNRQKITSFPELYELYDIVLKFIQESFTLYAEGSGRAAVLPRLQSAFCLLTTTQQASVNSYAFVDRCLTQLMKMFHRMVHDVINSPVNNSPQDSATLSQVTELLIQTLDIFKSRLNVMNTETRKNAFGPDFLYILERARDAKLFRAVVRILRDWVNVPKAEEHFAPTPREKVAFFVRLWAAYPRWSEHSEVARDILDCIYQVFSNVSPKTHEIFMKMEQAFCCGLLSPLPDIREKYVNLFLLGSDLTSVPIFLDNENEMSPNIASATPAKSSLLIRLLFLFMSNSWDELHYKDGFWLPVFFDVLLCDTDFSRPSVIVQSEARFPSLLEKSEIESNLTPQAPVNKDLLDTTDMKIFEVKMEDEPTRSTVRGSISVFECLMNQQATVFNDIKTISFRETLRGFLNLVHHRPAIASELFGELWHCLWHRFLLRESGLHLISPLSSCHPEVSQLSDSLVDASLVPPASTAGAGVDPVSPSELRLFLLPHITRFLSSDDHVNTADMIPSSIGNILTSFATTADSLLTGLPLPLLSYVGCTHNQWYNVALFFESLCARAQRTRICNGYNTLVDNDFTYTLTSGGDGNSGVLEKLEDIPLGAGSLSLLALYDLMAEDDYLVSAWWHRLNSPCGGSQRLKGLIRGQTSRFLLERSSDLLAAVTAFSQGHLLRGLEITMNILGNRSPGSDSSSLPTIDSSSLLQISEQINKSRLYEYGLRALKQMGQWENLDSLASLMAPSSTNSGGSTGGGEILGGSSMLGRVRVEFAWRHRDWSEVFSALSGLANEVPSHEQWRLALISASGCVTGRRAVNVPGELDSYTVSGSGGVGSSGSSGGANGATVPQGTSANSASNTSSANTSIDTAGLFSTSLLQVIDSENLHVMNSILREWRRLPLIVTNQHVRLLQACQQASEIYDGNLLLLQHTVPPPAAGTNSAPTPGVSPSRLNISQSLYDYKTVFRSWQARLPLVSDDLSFWGDLLTWRQIVLERIINTGSCSHKFTQERNNLLAACHRERALTLVQMAKGYRKFGLPGIAQQSLDSYTHSKMPPLFEKTKQEIKLKIADLRKEELLEGLELMEKTNIQQYEKREKARFFCYKAVFFSHFNKGDEATKNFGYATQMQDNLHKVWSVFGDFLENVYSSNRTAKRETSVSTTGIFAMQALMEAATVAGTAQHQSHADLARCLWLLTLDDAGDSFNSLIGATVTATTSNTSPSPTTSATNTTVTVSGSQSQRLARTFEERASRVHPDAFLPWLPSLSVCLLRPEGRYVASALRGIALAYPTALASVLRGLQHQLTIEVDRDRRIAAALTDLSPDQRRRLDEAYSHCVDLAREDARRRTVSSATAGSTEHSQQQQQHQGSVSMGGSAKRTKKRVVVVMRGAEGERLSEATSSQSSTEGVRESGSGEVQDMDVDEDDQDSAVPAVPEDSPGTEFEDAGGVRTGYLSPSVSEGLHRVNLLFTQLRQRHPARLYVSDQFVECTAGRLLPSWSENLLHHLRKVLDQLHKIAWAQVSRAVRRPSASLGPFQASVHGLSSSPLPPWMTKELLDIVACCGLPPPITATIDDLLAEDAENRSGSTLVFADNIQLAYTLLANEAEADPWFKPTKESLMLAMSNIGSKTLLETIGLLSKELIPLVERRVCNLPYTSYLSDRGAGYLIELISSLNVQSILSPFPRCVQNSATAAAAVATTCSTATLLELPGEAVRLKFIPALHQQTPYQGASSNPNPIVAATIANNVAAEGHQPGLLYLADILPTVVRVPSGGGRRLALRANNGRVFHYDVPCLPREAPAGRGVSVFAADATEASSLAPTLSAYEGWREMWCPPHLFQVLNAIASRFPETAKRRITLVTPRTLDLGPHGMRLTQAGTSIPATCVVTANAVSFGNPTMTGFGSLLAQQLHTPSSGTVSQPTSTTSLIAAVPLAAASSLLPSTKTDATRFPRSDAFTHLHGPEKQQPLHQVFTTLNANSSGYAGSHGAALEVAGHPTSLDSGCYAACMTLANIVDSAVHDTPLSTRSLTSKALVTTFFDRLGTLATADSKSTNLKATLLKIFEELLQLVPRGASLKSPAHLGLGVLSDEYYAPNSVVRMWAFRRMADAESYWLFRHGVAMSSGAMALMETLFPMTPLSATGLVLDPRVGRTETQGLRFDLPPTPNAINIPLQQQKDLRPVDLVAKSSTALANIFSSNFAPLRPHVPLSSGRAAVVQPISLPLRPATLRLTPQLAGLICLPGVPAAIGPFAAAMATLNQAVSQKRAVVVACLRALLRDDFILWHRGRQAAVHASLLADLMAIENDETLMATVGSPINVPDLSNDALIHMITLSVDGFNHRNRVLSSSDMAFGDVINGSCSPENLACMDPSWLPWY
ncbi:PIK kinase FAT and Armadillo domain containing protein [Echinococcus multilocularis]|uniref:PIK kinase FAT and Armadillo domain containing protein n=1 Tax=Echinococcus multilocularis TaxID=6211 RepID=A0A068Y142_ECHMU|nr:PIK kinase FAT and Armadillo domain containing protein [Echinococcus multilocularis]